MEPEYLTRLLRKLESIAPLAQAAKDAVGSLPVDIVQFPTNRDILREGDRPTRSFLLISGFICTSKIVSEGRRQITSVYVGGDIPDLQSLHLEVMDMSVTTLQACTVAFIQHEAIRRACTDHPSLNFALWRSTLIDAAIYREWVANTGQRSAHARTTHLICEVLERLRAVGLIVGDSLQFPMTQSEMSDALGLSVVHVQRVLRDLREQGLIENSGRTLRVPDWAE